MAAPLNVVRELSGGIVGTVGRELLCSCRECTTMIITCVVHTTLDYYCLYLFYSKNIEK